MNTARIILTLLAVFAFSSCGGSAPDVVKSFLDAEIAKTDSHQYLAPGANAYKVTGYEVVSYEIKNTSEDVVSVLVNFRGTSTHSTYRHGEIHGSSSHSIDMPETIRFRVKDGKITEVY